VKSALLHKSAIADLGQQLKTHAVFFKTAAVFSETRAVFPMAAWKMGKWLESL